MADWSKIAGSPRAPKQRSLYDKLREYEGDMEGADRLNRGVEPDYANPPRGQTATEGDLMSLLDDYMGSRITHGDPFAVGLGVRNEMLANNFPGSQRALGPAAEPLKKYVMMRAMSMLPDSLTVGVQPASSGGPLADLIRRNAR